MNAQRKCLCVGLTSLLLLSFLVSRLFKVDNLSVFSFILWGSVLIWLAVLAFICIHVSILKACEYTDARTLFVQYLSANIMECLGSYFARKREYESAHFQETQENFLLKLLSSRAKTVYGNDHGFIDMKSVADFRQRHPLTKYAHYSQYMDRIAQGEKNVITSGRASRIGLTSGTTGKQKLIPISKERQLLFLFKLTPMVMSIARKRWAPRESLLHKTCLLYVHTMPRMSEGGIPMGPVTMLTMPDILFRVAFSTPPAGMRLTNESQTTYVHLLFALRDRNLKCLSGIFATTIFTFFSRLEDDWQKVVNDLRRGCIGDYVGLDDESRNALERELDPEPDRADELEREFQKGFVGIAKRIWPHMKYMYGISTGAAAVYARRLQKTYALDVPILSMMYNATEGMLGSFYGDGHQYLPDASDIFYEFIPIDNSEEDQPDTLLAEELEAGQSYELVVTNMDSLYRYRVGDVIKVVGFHKKCPIMDFQYRSGEILSLKGEKTPEVSISTAVTDTFASELVGNTAFVNYACVESVLYEEVKGISLLEADAYYVIFIEVDPIDVICEETKRDEITKEFDTRLRNLAAGYNYQRKRGGIAPPQLVFLRPGSFVALRAHILANSSASAVQVKVPRKILKAEWLKELLSWEVK